jgi:polar amino acid transport system substrate-binding protein
VNRLSLALTLTAAFAFSTAALAEGGILPQVAARKTLRVGMLPGLAPFVAAGADAEELRKLLGDRAPPMERSTDGRAVCGFDVQLAAEAARALHASLEIVLVDKLDELLAGVRAGRFDVVMSALTRTLDRAVTVGFSDPYFSSGLQILVRDPRRFETLESVRAPGVKVAFRAGTTASAFVARELGTATPVPLDTDAALYAALDDPRAADAVVIDYVSARDAEVRGRVKSKLAAVEERRFTTEQFAFAFKQGDPDWREWLNLFLRDTKNSGAFHKLASRYNPWFRNEQ